MTDIATIFAGERFAVVGLGRNGLPAARALRAMGAEVQAWDDQESARAAASAEGIDVREPKMAGLSALVLSPGIAHRLRASLTASITASQTRIARQKERVAIFAGRAERALRGLIAARLARCESDGQLLAAFSYRGVLARGFTLVRDAAGQPLRSAGAVAAGTAMEIEFVDGRVGARLARDEMRGQVERRPTLTERRRVGPELLERVAQRRTLN